jgi:uncharacterized protein HemY
VDELSHADLIHIRAAEGWLELGDSLEANEELEKVAADKRGHPAVLQLRYLINQKSHRWAACVEIARTLTVLLSAKPQPWIWLADATSRASDDGVQKALEILIDAAYQFPADAIIRYNLACYACRSGDKNTAFEWLSQAFELSREAKKLKLQALDDKDLELLWTRVADM